MRSRGRNIVYKMQEYKWENLEICPKSFRDKIRCMGQAMKYTVGKSFAYISSLQFSLNHTAKPNL